MTPEQLIDLREAVEKKFGSVMMVDSDFSDLSHVLGTNVLSATTLKRVWGYNKDYNNISLKTVNILAKYLGYSSYDDFCARETPLAIRSIYDTAKIAKFVNRLQDERLEEVYTLLNKYQHKEILSRLDNIDNESEELAKNSKPIVDSVQSRCIELCLKSFALWCCNFRDEDILEQINKIFEAALPLAQSINDHQSLWFIYYHWAYWSSGCGAADKVVEYFDLAERNARIIQLEDPEDYPFDLNLTLGDMAYIFFSMGLYDRAQKAVEEVLSYKQNHIIGCYARINRVLIYDALEIEQDAVAVYLETLDKIALWNEQNTELSREAIYIEAIINYNLAMLCPDDTNAENLEKIAGYLRRAIALFRSVEIYDRASSEHLQNALEILEDVEALLREPQQI